MDLDDLYISPEFHTDTSDTDEAPFDPMAAEFLAHCNQILGERALAAGIEDGLAELRQIFERKLAKREDAGERVLLAAVMMVALHDAIVAGIPNGCVAQILALVGHDERTKACVAACDGGFP